MVQQGVPGDVVKRSAMTAHESTMAGALQRHWPEYLMEAAGLGIFMISAVLFTALLEYPGSPVHRAIADPALRRMLVGMAMGLTAISIVYSPWGKQSGAHLNPSVTLAFFRLGKIASWDALFYVTAQFVGGAAGVWIASVLIGNIAAHPTVDYAVTMPGPFGVGAAFLAEMAMSFALMSVVLTASNTAHLARYTGLFAGALVATYISLEAPLSGMSLNPARSMASALPAHVWTALWIYFAAPPLGMLLAAQLYLQRKGAQAVVCAKLHHHNDKRCIFCAYHQGT
jgi:aquaporin Z